MGKNSSERIDGVRPTERKSRWEGVYENMLAEDSRTSSRKTNSIDSVSSANKNKTPATNQGWWEYISGWFTSFFTSSTPNSDSKANDGNGKTDKVGSLAASPPLPPPRQIDNEEVEECLRELQKAAEQLQPGKVAVHKASLEERLIEQHRKQANIQVQGHQNALARYVMGYEANKREKAGIRNLETDRNKALEKLGFYSTLNKVLMVTSAIAAAAIFTATVVTTAGAGAVAAATAGFQNMLLFKPVAGISYGLLKFMQGRSEKLVNEHSATLIGLRHSHKITLFDQQGHLNLVQKCDDDNLRAYELLKTLADQKQRTAQMLLSKN